MEQKNINWWEPKIGNTEIGKIRNVIKKNFLSEGKLTKEFENKIKKFLNVKYCVLTSSGSAALYLSLKALNIKKGDQVLVPNITYVATVNAIKLAGATPKIVDVDKKNLSLDIDDLKKKINKKTKIIMPVHVSGRGGNIKKILSIANKHGIKVIEDAAEAFGSKIQKKNLGTFGILGCYSFTPTKILTTGQGGAVVGNRKAIMEKILFLKDQGRTKRCIGGDDQHDLDGFNFKFNDVLAAIGLEQFKRIRERIKKIEFINNYYNKKLKFIKKIKFLKKQNGEIPIWTEIVTKDRNAIFEYLLKNQIKCRKFWKPISSHKNFKQKEKFYNSQIVSKKFMWLPSGFHLNKKKLNYICSKIIDFYN